MLEGSKGGGGTAIDVPEETVRPASVADKSQTRFARVDISAQEFGQSARFVDRPHP